MDGTGRIILFMNRTHNTPKPAIHIGDLTCGDLQLIMVTKSDWQPNYFDKFQRFDIELGAPLGASTKGGR